MTLKFYKKNKSVLITESDFEALVKIIGSIKDLDISFEPCLQSDTSCIKKFDCWEKDRSKKLWSNI